MSEQGPDKELIIAHTAEWRLYMLALSSINDSKSAKNETIWPKP